MNLSPLKNELFSALQRKHPETDECENSGKINLEITDEQFCETLDRTKEEPSSSPSNLHVGHYKACSMSESLTSTLVKIINIPFIHGLTVPRWNESVHHMIQKVPGCNSIKNYASSNSSSQTLTSIKR